MEKGKTLFLITLISAIVTLEGWAVLSQPKILIERSPRHQVTTSPVIVFEPATPKAQLSILDSEPKEEELRLELLGTAIGNTKDPIAFIKNLESNKQGIYRLGSKIKDAQVIKIVLGEVTLDRNGKQEILKMSKRARAWAKIDDSIVLSKSEDMITVSRRGLLNQASNILNTLPSLKFKPYYEGGRAAGLVVEGIAEDSIIRQAGIQNKDTIKTVNGQIINSYQQALQVAGKVRNQSEISVSILRDGKPQNLSYRIAQ
jgi:type II secretion system protein C